MDDPVLRPFKDKHSYFIPCLDSPALEQVFKLSSDRDRSSTPFHCMTHCSFTSFLLTNKQFEGSVVTRYQARRVGSFNSPAVFLRLIATFSHYPCYISKILEALTSLCFGIAQYSTSTQLRIVISDSLQIQLPVLSAKLPQSSISGWVAGAKDSLTVTAILTQLFTSPKMQELSKPIPGAMLLTAHRDFVLGHASDVFCSSLCMLTR